MHRRNTAQSGRPIPEIATLQRESAEHRRSEETFKEAYTELHKRFRKQTADMVRANTRLQKEIEERRRVERALLESEERYRSIVEQSPDAIIVHDTEGKLLYANPVALKLTGTQGIDDLGGRSTFTTLPVEKLGAIQEGIEKMLRGEPVPPISMPMRLLDGRMIDVEATASRVMFDGQPAIQVVLRDITARKRTEEAIKEQEEQLRNLIENSSDGIIITDEMGRIMTWSRGMEVMTGLAAGDVLGMAAWEVQSWLVNEEQAEPDCRAKFRDSVETILRDNNNPYSSYLQDVQIRTPQGEVRHLQQRVFTTPTHRGFRIMAIIRDITEQKQANEVLRRQTRDLVLLNRALAAAHRETNLYLDILTHDIGNTENVSNLYAELLIDTLDGEAGAHLQKLHRSIRKSIEILATVGKIRKIHRGALALMPSDLDAVIREEIDHFPETVIRYEGAFLQVYTDELLPEVIANLIGNAVKHGGPGVMITIRVEDQDGVVQVSVEDTGPGVPDGRKKEIFHRYEQKKRGVGEGLGLYLVQILIQRYGGKVWVEDRVPGHPEEGAAFRFTLKSVQGPAQPL